METDDFRPDRFIAHTKIGHARSSVRRRGTIGWHWKVPEACISSSRLTSIVMPRTLLDARIGTLGTGGKRQRARSFEAMAESATRKSARRASLRTIKLLFSSHGAVSLRITPIEVSAGSIYRRQVTTVSDSKH